MDFASYREKLNRRWGDVQAEHDFLRAHRVIRLVGDDKFEISVVPQVLEDSTSLDRIAPTTIDLSAYFPTPEEEGFLIRHGPTDQELMAWAKWLARCARTGDDPGEFEPIKIRDTFTPFEPDEA